jgi:hypothetical protein
MSGVSVKRSLFQTPTRASKRARSTKRRNSQIMRVPAYLKPETKQYFQNALTSTLGGVVYSSIPTDMAQGDASNQFVGSKVRLTRLRVYYDFSNITFTTGVRITVLIPKKAGSLNTVSVTGVFDTDRQTILHDMLLPNDPSVLAGTFDVTGPINVEFDTDGNLCQRNDLHILVASSNPTSARTQLSYSVWYTDA